MFPKTGKKLPRGPQGYSKDDEFRQAVSTALKSELGATHQAIKTVMRWTGASERTVKHWFAASHSPSGHHLVAMARHSDEVLMCFLLAADRSQLSVALQWVSLRSMLMDLVETIDSQSAD